jgi:hypothetical protein
MATLKMLWFAIVQFVLSLFQKKTVIVSAPPYTPGPILPPPPTEPEIELPTIPNVPAAPPVSTRPPMPTKPDVHYTADHSDGFYLKLADGFINELHTDPHHVLTIMANESGLKANAVNQAGPAYGLIQFFGSQNAYIANLTAEEQVPHILAFYRGHAPYASVGEVYGETFLPARMLARGRAPSTVLTQDPEIYYRVNSGLDYDRNGDITIEDLENQANAAAKALGPRWKEAVARLDWAIATLGLETPGKLPIAPIVAGVGAAIAVGLALVYWKS